MWLRDSEFRLVLSSSLSGNIEGDIGLDEAAPPRENNSLDGKFSDFLALGSSDRKAPAARLLTPVPCLSLPAQTLFETLEE